MQEIQCGLIDKKTIRNSSTKSEEAQDEKRRVTRKNRYGELWSEGVGSHGTGCKATETIEKEGRAAINLLLQSYARVSRHLPLFFLGT